MDINALIDKFQSPTSSQGYLSEVKLFSPIPEAKEDSETKRGFELTVPCSINLDKTGRYTGEDEFTLKRLKSPNLNWINY